MLIDHLLVAPPAYRTTWLEPIIAAVRAGRRHPDDPARDARPRAPVPRSRRVRQGVGDARRAVGRPLDPRRRRGLDRGRVRGPAHPASRAGSPDERDAGGDHRAVGRRPRDVRGPVLPVRRPDDRAEAGPATASADLDRRRHPAVREDLRPAGDTIRPVLRRIAKYASTWVPHSSATAEMVAGDWAIIREEMAGFGRDPDEMTKVYSNFIHVLGPGEAPGERGPEVPRLLGHGPRLLAGVLPARRGRGAGRPDPRQDRGARRRRARDPQPARLEPRDARAARVRRPAAAAATDGRDGPPTCDRPASTRRSRSLATDRGRCSPAGPTCTRRTSADRSTDDVLDVTALPGLRGDVRFDGDVADPGPGHLDRRGARRAAAGVRRAEGRGALDRRASRSRTAGPSPATSCNASPAADGLPNLMALDARGRAVRPGRAAGDARRGLRGRQPADGPARGMSS